MISSTHVTISEAGRLAFISHASENAALAARVAVALGRASMRTWLDDDQLHRLAPETLASSRIWDALAASTDFVALVSSAAMKKLWVVHEWQVASARWLASGMPRIHVVLCESELELPNLPYLNLFHADDTLDDELVRIFSSSESGIEIPQKDEDWSQVIGKLRSQYLMGGPTAAQAVHYFDYLFPELARRIDKASDAEFSLGHQVELRWLLSLARLLDLRAKPQWLREKLEVACHAEELEISTRNKFQNNLGTSYVYSGKWDEAAGWISKAIEGCKQQGDLAGLAMGLGNLALLEVERGDVQAASNWLREGRLALARAANQLELQPDRNLLMEVLGTEGNLNNHEGRIHARLGAFERAYVCFANHLAITESLENRNGIGVALGWIAYTDILCQRTTLRTTMALRRYMSLSIESFNPRGAANAHAWNGQALRSPRRSLRSGGPF